jgi:hypothetical protein
MSVLQPNLFKHCICICVSFVVEYNHHLFIIQLVFSSQALVKQLALLIAFAMKD